MTPANDELPAGFEEEAAEWCWRLADGVLEPGDQETFDRWLHADPRHREAFENVATVWHGTDAIAEMPGFLSLRAKALTTMERARNSGYIATRQARVQRGFAAAAAILLMIVSSVWYFQSGPDIYSTGIGERQVVRLEDGSKISLDASSRVEVDYSAERRSLTLERGRAKFDVAKDPLRPFAVTAANKTVIATGTSFSVELLRKQVRVLLYEGNVAVLDRPEAATSISPTGPAHSDRPADRVLRPGDELVADIASDAATIASSDVERSLSWEGGRLSFIDEPLASAVERVNRYSDTPIVVSDPVAGRLLINGVFDAGDTDSFVSGVASLYPITVRRSDARILISRGPSSAPR